MKANTYARLLVEQVQRYASDPTYRAKKKAQAKAYAERNRETINAARRAARAADPEAARITAQARRQRHLEKMREADRRYAARNPDKVRAKRRRRALRRFGLSPADFAAIIERQRGRCAICEGDLPERRHTHLDHDHKTGRVRGVLCLFCNLLLGHAKDNTRTLARAIAYLEGNT